VKFFILDMSKRFYETAIHSDFYAQCRPTYLITDDDLAIDIGCGTGQSTALHDLQSELINK
jgi:SAM-dependent methyltransferase